MTDSALRHPLAGPIFRAVIDLGYRVSVFDLPTSLLRTIPPAYEAHAVDVSTDPPDVHVVKVIRDGDGDDEAALYRLACELAASVGITTE